MANINSMNVGGQLSMVEDTAAREMEANAYDPTQIYAKEDICIYNDKLYEANTAITTPEVFNIAHWTETTLGKIAQKHRDSISQLTEKTLKVRVKKSLSTGEWQAQDTVKSIDTGIDSMTDDIPVIYLNNSADSSKLTFIPCLKDNHWYISSYCSIPSGGGPDSIIFIVLNV